MATYVMHIYVIHIRETVMSCWAAASELGTASETKQPEMQHAKLMYEMEPLQNDAA